MPPHIESHSHSDWAPRSKSTGDIKNSPINALCGCLDSPLFRDEDDEPTSKQLSRLDRRQSNPDLLAAGSSSQDLAAIEQGAHTTAPQFVSKIESIIGPESRYYNSESQKRSTTAPQPTAPRKMVAAQETAPKQQAAVVQKTAAPAPTPTVAQSTQEVLSQPDITTATTKYNKSSNRKPLMTRMTHAVSKKSWRLVRYIGEKGKRFMSLMVKSVDPTRGTYEA